MTGSSAAVGVDIRRRTVDRSAALVFTLLTVNALIAIAVDVLNLVFIEGPWGEYSKVVNPVLVVIAGIALVRQSVVRVNAFVILTVAVIPLGIVVGLLQGAEPRYFIAHLFEGIFIAVLYWYGYNVQVGNDWLEAWVRRFSNLVLAGYAAALLYFWTLVLGLGQSLFFGVATGDLVLPFVYFAGRRHWRRAAFCVFLILISGKRSSALVVVFIGLVLVFARWIRSLTWNAGLVAAGFGALVLAGFAFLALADVANLPPALFSIVGKYELLNPFDAAFDPGLGTSGRSAEIEWAFVRFNDVPSAWAVGLGYGWSYFNGAIIQGIGTREFFSGYVHFSPLNFLFLYGAPLAILIVGLIWRQLARAYALFIRDGIGSLGFLLTVAVFGSFVQGLSGFSYGTDPLLWVVFGYVAGAVRDRAHRHP